jgi:hypothetical protein
MTWSKEFITKPTIRRLSPSRSTAYYLLIKNEFETKIERVFIPSIIRCTELVLLSSITVNPILPLYYCQSSFIVIYGYLHLLYLHFYRHPYLYS